MTKHLILTVLLLTITFSTFSQLAPSQVNSYTTHIYMNGNKVVQDVSVEVQVNSAKGVDVGSKRLYHSDEIKIKQLDVAMFSFNGTEIKRLKSKDYKTYAAYTSEAFHSNAKYTQFELMQNTYPYLIKCSFRRELEAYNSLCHWTPFWKDDVDVRSAELIVDLPEDFEFRMDTFGIDSFYTAKLEGLMRYGFVCKQPKIINYEPFSPTWWERTPKVEIMPKRFFYGGEGSADTWTSYGQWYADIAKGLLQLPPEEVSKVQKMTDHLTDKKEKVKTLYNYLQDNTRYVNISLELGGLTPPTATTVCTNKYGDCKALTIYMQAMLKAIGIESHYTLVNAGTNEAPIKEEFPAQQFNHIILCVPLDNDTIWLENTSSTVPFNYMGTFTQGRKALIIKDKESQLVDIPYLKQPASNFNTDIYLDGDQPRFQLTARLYGALYEYFRSFSDHVSESQQTDILDEIELIDGIDVTNLQLHKAHRDSAFIDLVIEGNVPRLTDKIGSKTIVKPFHPFTLKMNDPAKRQNCVVIPYSIHLTDSIRMHFNQPIKKVAGAADVKEESPYGNYSYAISSSDSTVHIVRSANIKRNRILLNDYQTFYDFIQTINTQETKKLLIE